MLKFNYSEPVVRSVSVGRCPSCTSDDIIFDNSDGNGHESHPYASVKCRTCEKEVVVNGNDDNLNTGLKCQLAAIEVWNSECDEFDLKQKLEIERVAHENRVLKSVTLHMGYVPTEPRFRDYKSAVAYEMACEFYEIMKKFKEECERHG